MQEDEYHLRGLISKFEKDLNEHLDERLGDYLSSRDEIRRAAFTEMVVCLQMAIIQTDDYKSLKQRILEIVKSITDKE